MSQAIQQHPPLFRQLYPPLARRMRRIDDGVPRFDPEQLHIESQRRARVARKIRTILRRMAPVVLLSPRWSQPLRFIDELAPMLAQGQPAVACRTASLRTVKSRALPEIWNALVEVFSRMVPAEWRPEGPSSVADRRGFRWSLRQLLQHAHREAPHPIALMVCEAEHLPLSVWEDVALVWEEYWERHPDAVERRCTLLLAGSVHAHWLKIGDAPRIPLEDFSESEALSRMVSGDTPSGIRTIRAVARFTGGIPSVVDRFSAHYDEHGFLPAARDGLLQILGTLSDEMRGAVDIIAADEELSSRLEQLLSGVPLREERRLDEPLRMAGLVRTISPAGQPHVILRAPALAALLG
ncbi:MAG: hypothetical protein AAFV53_13845 [Myxococcota bacterium]